MIELLVVISIILMLLALLVPSYVGIRERGGRILCLSNMRQLQLASSLYASDHAGNPPSAYTGVCRGASKISCCALKLPVCVEIS